MAAPLRILLLGHKGQVGWELGRTLAPLGAVTGVDFPAVDLADPDSIRQWVREVRPRLIVNAAAYTAVDRAESEPELALKINGAAPGVLAGEAVRAGALLVHYSTDYVFDGTKPEPYVETDPPRPLGAYGRTKLAGDEAVRQAGAAHLIFRLCWVYGTRGQNFLLTMMRLAREREKLRVVRDQTGCPSWSRLIAEATAQAVRQVLASPEPEGLHGTYHLAASGACTWHAFASAIVERMPAHERKCREVEAITTAEYPTPARRPAYSVLNTDKLDRTFGVRLPDWEAGLRLALET
jgi:dTDP-4-dehydrorhamnose reductase